MSVTSVTHDHLHSIIRLRSLNQSFEMSNFLHGANFSKKITPIKARKSTKFRHINPIKPDFEDSSGALMIMMLLVDFAHRIV